VAWTVTVEVAFSTDPMSTSPSWTNITAYVLVDSIEITRGRPDEFGQVQPATLRLVLKNGDGRFTMGYASGAYFPNVKPGKRIRVSVLRSAVTYFRFDGHVNGWPTAYAAPVARAALSEITATDRLKRFGEGVGDLRSMLEEEILLDDPAAYYPLAEPQGALSAASVAISPQATLAVSQYGVLGELDFAAGTGPGTDGLGAPLFTPTSGTNGKYLAGDLYTPAGSSTGVSLEAWFATAEAPVSRTICSLQTLAGGELRLAINASGKLQAFNYNPAVDDDARLYDFASSPGYNDDRTHQVVLTESRSGSTVTWRLYADGVQFTSGTYTAGALPPYSRLVVGSDGASGQVWQGTLSHVAAYSSAISATRVGVHNQAGTTGILERTDQRIGRLADYLGIPTADRNLDVGDGQVAGQSASGKAGIEAMREVEATEAGVLFMAGDGDLTFHNRTRRYNTSPAVTLTAKQLAAAPTFPGDDSFMVNDMTVSRAGASPARAVNQASIDEFGLYRDSADIISASDGDAQAMADWRVAAYGTPRVRVPNITVEVKKLEAVGSSLVAGVLAAEISTKLRVTTLPAGAPASQVDLFVEGWTETIGSKVWWITFNTSPGDAAAELQGGTVWDLGTAGFSELGTTTYVAL
jgi:hypothetical protein